MMTNIYRVFFVVAATAAAAQKPSFIKNAGVKLCINCAHFIHHTSNYPYDAPPNNKFGKCALFGEQDPVTGEIDHYYASTCRKSGACGEEAKQYKERSSPPPPPTATQK